MQFISVSEAERRFSWLLTAVSLGKSFTITRHGKPVAVLRPISAAYPDADKAIDELLEFSRDTTPLGGLSIRAMIEEGRA